MDQEWLHSEVWSSTVIPYLKNREYQCDCNCQLIQLLWHSKQRYRSIFRIKLERSWKKRNYRAISCWEQERRSEEGIRARHTGERHRLADRPHLQQIRKSIHMRRTINGQSNQQSNNSFPNETNKIKRIGHDPTCNNETTKNNSWVGLRLIIIFIYSYPYIIVQQ